MGRLLAAVVMVAALGACSSAATTVGGPSSGETTSRTAVSESPPSAKEPEPSTPGPSTPTDEPAPAVTLRVGDTVTVSDGPDGISGSVEVTLEKILYEKGEGGLPAGWIYCVLLVSVRNVGDATSTGPFMTYPVWKGADGRFEGSVQPGDIDMSDPVQNEKDHLITGILNPGESQRGLAILEVPDDQPGRVIFSTPGKMVIPVDPTSAA